MAELADYERRFRRAGLPLFIEDYSAREDVWTRAAPLFALVFIGEMLGAIDLDWPVLANVGAALGGLAILLGAFGLLNLLRGRPFWSLPEDVGPLELAGSVFVAAQLPREVRQLEEGAGSAGPPLETPQRFNVGLVMFVGQALQILVVSLAIGAFFVVFGALAVGADIREAWDVEHQDVLLRLTLFGEPDEA